MSDRLDEIAKRAEAATAGPWVLHRDKELGWPRVIQDVKTERGTRFVVCNFPPTSDDKEANADFIAHAREDIPWLLSELSSARATIAALKEGLKEEREECAKIADQFADTKPVLSKSDNAVAANVIATVMSDTGRKIAQAIRARALHKGEGHD